ncbi:alpha/beta hydrolase [Altererythrobacter sp. CC-YST694]|uniref:alpha/beta hydrolase n=1 Tax=Altererythrobacter sp. CC-YST694 TaxID=2755038 RepID=UPI00299F63E3|nr:alpha/beta hydrolase [Altererythrobacter sp. CC-YST694]
MPVNAVESFWHAEDGWPIRRIDWPLPTGGAKGSILFLPGRGDCYEKYLETLDHWARDGWRVTASDWRGQAGSGRLGNDAVTGHVPDFAVWIADLAWFWSRWIAETPGPHIIAGHSMGGHLVLRALAEKAVQADGAILSAPMLGFHSWGLPSAVMHAVAGMMAGLGDRRRPAWKWSEKPGEVPEGRDQLLTHDRDRYSDELWWRQHRPELVMGPGSWGWVERAYASTRLLERPGVLEAVQTPVFVVATENDRLVSYPAIERAVRRLPHGELFRFGTEAHHEILREADEVRNQALEAIDGFLSKIASRRQ